MKNNFYVIITRHLKFRIIILFDHLISLLTTPISITYSRYRRKVWAIILLILIIVLNLCAFQHDTQSKGWELVNAVTHHLASALILFILFEGEIKQLLSAHKFKESDKFIVENYFLQIEHSYDEIKILETFIEMLILRQNDFIESLKRFVINCKRKNMKGSIKILLIDPESTFAAIRMQNLKKLYLRKSRFKSIKTDEEYEKQFKIQMYNWLKDLQNIQSEITSCATRLRANIEFEIRIYDAIPHYSLYSADNFASFGFYRSDKPTIESEQLEAYDLKSSAAEYLLSSFNDIWDSNQTDSLTVPLGDFLTEPNNPERLEIVRKFKSISNIINKHEIHALLREMSPARILEKELFGLVKYIQKLRNNINPNVVFPKVHYNIFGTGGDRRKTINISTISSIVASHYDNLSVIKVGTVGVTSIVGSENFYKDRAGVLREISQNPEYKDLNLHLLDYNIENGSKYLSVEYFGYEYKEIIRDARRDLYNEDELDIYKVIFPVSNLTNSSAQVNGVHKHEYIHYFEIIYQRFDRSGIILHSLDYDIDELVIGKNQLIYYKDGKRIGDEILSIPCEMDENEYWDFFKERNSQQHIIKFAELFNHKTHKTIKMTICYNVASIVKLAYLEDKKRTIEDIANEVYQKFFL